MNPNGCNPVSPFVVDLRPAPPVTHERAVTALPRSPRSRRAPCLVRPHSHSVGFELPRRLRRGAGNHPGTHGTSRVSDGLRPNGHVGSRSYPAGLVAACARLPPRHDHRADYRRAFPTQKPEAGGYHIGRRSSRFGIVSVRSHWQGLVAPFMVELFVVRRFGGSPRPMSPGRVRLRTRTPHASRVERAASLEKLGPDPACGILTRFVPSRPHTEVFPRRPASGRANH